jgi:hypothetical protein
MRIREATLRVTENGVFDEPSHELRAAALIPLEDRKRDENVREITISLPAFYVLLMSDAEAIRG